MSRIGKKSIVIPEKVTIKLDGQKISVDGPKGNLSRILPSLVCCTMMRMVKTYLLKKLKILNSLKLFMAFQEHLLQIWLKGFL